MKATVLSLTTDVITKEEIVSTLQDNHEQNGENNNGKVKAVSSCQDKEEIISALQSNHEQHGENNNTQVKVVSSCQDGMQEEIVSTLQSNHEQNGENNNAGVEIVPSCQDGVQANALIPFHPNPRELDKIPKVISLRENLLSEAALKALYRKRDMLANALIPFHPNPRELDKIPKVISLRENLLSEAALKALYRKRDMLLRSIEDELALCNRYIQAILSGSEDILGVKLDSIIEGCKFENLSSGVSDHERIYQRSQDQNTRKCLKRKRLCEANLSVLNPCQELDDKCHENCWMLPTYNISTFDVVGGFQAAVTVMGVDFEFSK